MSPPSGAYHATERKEFDHMGTKKSTRAARRNPVRKAHAQAQPIAAALAASAFGTAAEKITYAKHVVLSTVAAHDAGTLEDANYDLHWPLSLVVELLEQASLQLDAEETINAMAQRQAGKGRVS